jgi:hypothetical protein
LPSDLADALETQYRNLLDHYLKEEWDDAQVDAGRFSEAVLRVIEWHMTGSYTPIGRSSPSRKQVVQQAGTGHHAASDAACRSRRRSS